MDKEFIKKMKKRLEQEKSKLTKELRFFAKKDPKIKGNWKTRFPFLGFNRSHTDETAEEVEEYERRLSIEHTLELRLRDVDGALERIKKGTYGYCDNCKKEIEKKRLEAVPEAKTCLGCE